MKARNWMSQPQVLRRNNGLWTQIHTVRESESKEVVITSGYLQYGLSKLKFFDLVEINQCPDMTFR